MAFKWLECNYLDELFSEEANQLLISQLSGPAQMKGLQVSWWNVIQKGLARASRIERVPPERMTLVSWPFLVDEIGPRISDQSQQGLSLLFHV